MITILPAIDLQNGRCVRLRQGVESDSKIYSDDPAGMARRWVAEGATYLHVVDLDGAFQGCPAHLPVIARIIEAAGVPVEVGGGLRTDDDIRSVLKCGAARAIIGTRALQNTESLKALVAEFGEKLSVGIDARNGMVQVKGWVETTTVKAVDLAAQADSAGVKTIIYTDTSKDGMLNGVNALAIGDICVRTKCDIIASGGITTASDVKTLLALKRKNLIGAIVGKALYEGKVTLKELLLAGA